MDSTPFPEAVAVLFTEPAVISAAVMVYVPLQFSEAPGASPPVGQVTEAILLSLTVNGPANANVAPPGYYMLVILNKQNIPSVMSFVLVQ